MKKLLFTLLMVFAIIPSTYALTLKEGDILEWRTTSSSGKMVVTWVQGNRFELEQSNYDYPNDRPVIMKGEAHGSSYTIRNSSYEETWIGKASRNEIRGKVNQRIAFTIRTAQRSHSSRRPNSSHNTNSTSWRQNDRRNFIDLNTGDEFDWASNSNHGIIRITSVSGNRFTLEQNNFDNRSAGWVRMSGTFRKGEYTIRNPRWNEKWILYKNSRGGLSGKINKRINITLTPRR